MNAFELNASVTLWTLQSSLFIDRIEVAAAKRCPNIVLGKVNSAIWISVIPKRILNINKLCPIVYVNTVYNGCLHKFSNDIAKFKDQFS